MTQYRTNNPLGSMAPRDLFDNAQNVDNWSNGEEPFYEDRFGVMRRSFSGMNFEFEAAQEGRSAAFDAQMAALGYVSKGAYAAGVVLERYNEYVAVPGVVSGGTPAFYRPGPDATLPLTLEGDWAIDGPLLLQMDNDDVLRQDLALSSGARLVGGVSPQIDSVAQLRTIAGRYNGDTIHLTGYYVGENIGGGPLKWVDSSTTADDGFKVFAVEGVTTGRWVRQGFDLSLDQAGASPSRTPAQNKAVLDAVIAAHNGKDLLLTIPPYLDYGRARTQPATWPDFSTATDPATRIIIRDYAANDPEASNPAARSGAQEYVWYHTGNGADGFHNGNFEYLNGNWHPGYFISHNGDRAEMAAGMGINRRAGLFFATNGEANWRVGQGHITGDYTEAELAAFMVAANGLPGIGVVDLTTVMAILKTNGFFGINVSNPTAPISLHTRAQHSPIFRLDSTLSTGALRLLLAGKDSTAEIQVRATEVAVVIGGSTMFTVYNTGNVKAARGVGGGAYTTAERNALGTVEAGTMVFDTTLGKPIWKKVTGASAWVDATGATV